MRRIIDHFLAQWKTDALRKPLLMRGARQVGKTYSVRNFGKTYNDFAEINLELQPNARNVFENVASNKNTEIIKAIQNLI